MAEMAKTDKGIVRPARMNERVDRYVAERVEEGDQHASQGGIAGFSWKHDISWFSTLALSYSHLSSDCFRQSSTP